MNPNAVLKANYRALPLFSLICLCPTALAVVPTPTPPPVASRAVPLIEAVRPLWNFAGNFISVEGQGLHRDCKYTLGSIPLSVDFDDRPDWGTGTYVSPPDNKTVSGKVTAVCPNGKATSTQTVYRKVQNPNCKFSATLKLKRVEKWVFEGTTTLKNISAPGTTCIENLNVWGCAANSFEAWNQNGGELERADFGLRECFPRAIYNAIPSGGSVTRTYLVKLWTNWLTPDTLKKITLQATFQHETPVTTSKVTIDLTKPYP